MIDETKTDYAEESEVKIHKRVDRDMKIHLDREGFGLEEKIVLSARKLAVEGHSESLAGQVTVRAPDGDTFWSTDFSRNFGEVRRRDVVRFDRNMRVVEGSGMPNPAVRFHLWVYDRQPDTEAIVHTHPPFASALSMLGEELAIAHMDAMMFFDNCGYLQKWPGLPFGNREGEIISRALDGKKTALLGHHGIIAAGVSLEESLYLAISFEHAARLQLRARAIGEIQAVQAELGPEAREFLLSESHVNATFDSWGRMMVARFPEVLD